jgi:hypothetical protein
VAAWVPEMFENFYLLKNHKTANNSTATEAREKLSTYLGSLILEICFAGFTKFKNYQIL